MTEQQHPITPPPELVEQWTELPLSQEEQLVVAARWGADTELEACCEWLIGHNWRSVEPALRAARRPKPPPLKEQALEALYQIESEFSTGRFGEIIRCALETLND